MTLKNVVHSMLFVLIVEFGCMSMTNPQNFSPFLTYDSNDYFCVAKLT